MVDGVYSFSEITAILNILYLITHSHLFPTPIIADDFDQKLEQELQDYELVGGAEIDEIGDDEDDALEREILQQIEEEANSLT